MKNVQKFDWKTSKTVFLLRWNTHPQENLRWPNSKSNNCIVSSNSCPPWKPKWPAHSPELWQQPKSPSSPSGGRTWVRRTPGCSAPSWRNCQNSSRWSSNLSVPPTWWRSQAPFYIRNRQAWKRRIFTRRQINRCVSALEPFLKSCLIALPQHREGIARLPAAPERTALRQRSICLQMFQFQDEKPVPKTQKEKKKICANPTSTSRLNWHLSALTTPREEKKKSASPCLPALFIFRPSWSGSPPCANPLCLTILNHHISLMKSSYLIHGHVFLHQSARRWNGLRACAPGWTNFHLKRISFRTQFWRNFGSGHSRSKLPVTLFSTKSTKQNEGNIGGKPINL